MNVRYKLEKPPTSNAVENNMCGINMKMPVLDSRNPKLYFIQIEAQFRAAKITQDEEKYDVVIGSLDSEILQNIANMLPKLQYAPKYDSIKDCIIRNCADSENRRVCKVLEEYEFEDNKPSVLLLEMRKLAAEAVYENDLKRLWLDKLPEAVRAVVSIANDLNCCAKQADKMVELGTQPPVAQTATTDQLTTCNLNSVMEAIKTLSNEISGIKSSQSSLCNCENNNGSKSQQDVENKDHVPFTSQNIDNIHQQANKHVEKKEKLSKSATLCNFLNSEMDKLDNTFDEVELEIISILMKAKQKEKEIKQTNHHFRTPQPASEEDHPGSSHSSTEFTVIYDDVRTISSLSELP